MAYKGKFKPNNPEKYRGDHQKITYRSLWELKVFRYLDRHPDVIWWQSEETVVPYKSPKDNKMHRYFPDIVVHKKVPGGSPETVMIEIKPDKQTRPPDISKKHATKTGRVSRRFLNEAMTYAINESKWEAAKKFCDARGWKFVVMTEKDIF
tara:strand:+ start:127 stop:579 length:453 start_codon:yes stop_codon:yes gene_type:complete